MTSAEEPAQDDDEGEGEDEVEQVEDEAEVSPSSPDPAPVLDASDVLPLSSTMVTNEDSSFVTDTEQPSTPVLHATVAGADALIQVRTRSSSHAC
jgi:hypothetical protein